MFEFVFEGALLPFTYNGDRDVLFALLPRRKPRTSVQPPYRYSYRHRVTVFKELNLTAAGYSDSRALLGDGLDFWFSVAGRPLTAAFRLAEPAGSTAAGLERDALCERGISISLRGRA